MMGRENYTPITERTQMRDAAINRLFDLAKEDKRIMFVTADMGAPAMDRFKEQLPGQFRDVGIAEQA
jgi:transketolase